MLKKENNEKELIAIAYSLLVKKNNKNPTEEKRGALFYLHKAYSLLDDESMENEKTKTQSSVQKRESVQNKSCNSENYTLF